MSDPSGTMDFLTANFAQLATTQNLQPGSKRYRKAQAQFIVAEFNAYFGEDTKLANWQKLCTDMGIEGPPRSINKCRKACCVLPGPQILLLILLPPFPSPSPSLPPQK